MGPKRDKNAQEQQKTDGWKEKNICKRYLVGFCPNSQQDNWFHNTRRKDINVCCKIHSERLRTDFEEHADYERYVTEYERDFLEFLEGLVREADAWISREIGNCQGPGRVTKMPPSVRQKSNDFQERSENLMKQAEDLAEQGNVAASKQCVEQSAKLKEDVKELKEKHTYESGGETVCQVCGVRCNPDEPADYQAHLDGRLHEGYTKIRTKVKELREKMRNQPAKREKDRDRDRDREKGEGGDRDRDRGDGKDRAEGGDRGDRGGDRPRRRDGDRGGDRHGDRGDRKDDREKDRDRDRGGRDRGNKEGGERERKRSRSRERRR